MRKRVEVGFAAALLLGGLIILVLHFRSTDRGECTPGDTWDCILCTKFLHTKRGNVCMYPRKGKKLCEENGRWGLCTASQESEVEICDRVDNNGNGAVDEGCECARAGMKRSCGVRVGECDTSAQICEDGFWGLCVGTNPQPERSDGLDNDCDGIRDDGFDCSPGDMRSCGVDVGACTEGTQTCDDNGRWGLCRDAINPTNEICGNSVDDDCDGAVDDPDEGCSPQ